MPEINPSGTKTVRRGKDEARLVITFEVKFTKKALEQAPKYSTSGVDILRDLLKEAGLSNKEVIEACNKDIAAMNLDDLATIVDVNIEAAP